MKIVIQKKTKKENPTKSGWYDTDKDNLYWNNSEKQWSCRSEYISEEYPMFWYENLYKKDLDKPITFQNDLEGLLDHYDMLFESNTPCYILANFIMKSLTAFNESINEGIEWYEGENQKSFKPTLKELKELDNINAKKDRDEDNER